MKINSVFLIAAFLFLSAGNSFSDEAPFLRGGIETPRIVIENNFSKKPVEPGDHITGSFFVTIPASWHVYAPGNKKYINLDFTNGAGPVKEVVFNYPPGEMIDLLGEEVFVYQGKVEIIVSGVISADVNPGRTVWSPVVKWQSCSETICLKPETKTLEVEVFIGRKS